MWRVRRRRRKGRRRKGKMWREEGGCRGGGERIWRGEGGKV